jgi:hypothetical protein
MHAALWKLFRLKVRGSFRSMGRKVKSVRGALLAAFTLLVFGLMFGPNLAMALIHRDTAMGASPESLRDLIPVGMLAFVVLNIVTSLGERAIYFSPSDVDFLFPAPFSRRQILLYKILGSVTGAIFVALIFSVSFIIHIRSWPAALVGIFLGMLMLNSLTVCAQLAANSVTERAFTRARKLLLGGVIVAAAAALGQAAGQGINGPWLETLRQARHSLAAEIILAPFSVFAKIIAAERLVPDALGWAALGALLVVGIYALAIRLDANYLETAVRVSQKMQERKRRMLSDGLWAGQSKRPVRSARMPQPPWLGGVGPLMWRQAIQSLRGGRAVIVLVAIVVIAAGAPLAFAARENKELSKILPHFVIGIAAYVTFLYSSQAPFGFRGDYARMDVLKSLPIRAIAMACGQMLVVVVVLTLLQWLAFAVAAVLAPAAAAELLIAALMVVPFNWLAFGTESLLFLLYPSPLVATGSEGFLKMGRVMLFMIAKFFVLGVCAAVAAIPAAVVYFVTRSMFAAWFAAWFALLLPAVGILLLVAWAYQRYDVGGGESE